MKQHAIDLMPASIRARTLAGLRTGRFLAATSLVVLFLAVVATHSRLHLNSAENALPMAKAEAESVFAIDARVANLRRELEGANAFIARYEKVSFPLSVSALIATVVNAMPESVTLDQFDVDAGARTVSRLPRSRGVESKDDSSVRVLTCELSGFAASDEHIAELVSRLESTRPFSQVSLDFSRTKKVNERDAREFRLSFKVDLNVRYAVTYRSDAVFPPTGHAEDYANAQ